MWKAVLILLALFTTGCTHRMYAGISAGYSRPVAIGPWPVGRWDNVMRLPPSSTIDVLSRSGTANVGNFASADAESVTLNVTGRQLRISRAEIVRIDLVDLPGSEATVIARSAARGALVGAGVMTVMGAVLGGEYWPPPGSFLRAGVAGGAAMAGQATAANRQPRIVYVAPPGGGPRSRDWGLGTGDSGR
jgi:hypothetical protein